MSDYYSIPTSLGAAKLAAAANDSQALTLSHMAFGDANSAPYLPTTRVGETQLLNERYRVAVQFVTQDSLNPNVYIIKARIPANIGGFDINEIGIFDTDGELIYLANYPRTFKPQITQGAGGELTIKLHIMTSYSSAISIVLDPNVITLTQDEGDNRYALKTELTTEEQAREDGDLALAISLAAEITNRTNAITNLLTPKSLARFKNITGGLCQWQRLMNVDSIVRTAYGWEVFFDNDLSTNDYVVIGNVTDGGGYGGRSFEPYDYQLSGFKIKSNWGGDNTTGASTDDTAIVNFLVF